MKDTIDRALEQWPAIGALLDQALEQPTGARSNWVEQRAHAATALKGEVRRLLARGRQQPEPHIVGPWRLIAKIGEGGMASVWLAERADGVLKRPAAVKLPHGGWQRGILGERLKREQEILARLDHPNIARLLDAGIDSAGQPYLVLEYVDGTRIDEHCRDNALTAPEVLRLFLAAADAIAAAHRMLIIHRDLKPSNILVTSAGEVRILDFGIAKLLDGTEAHDTDLTAWSGRAMTPGYASPEQAAGRPLTVGTDVYSLAVVLHELLTGERPGKGVPLRGDLGMVLDKALREDPEDRYSTVEAFADDVRRFLENRPVRARRDNPWYRASKFVRRHAIGVAGTVVAAAMVLAGTAGMAWQTRIALEQKRQAEETRTSLVALLLDAHAYRGGGRPVQALDLLRKMEQRVSGLAVEAHVRVEVANQLGASLLSLQDTRGAERVLTLAVADAGKLEPAHPQRSRARLLRNWVRLFRGQQLEALTDLNDLIPAMRGHTGTFPEDLPGALRLRSAILRESGRAGEAEVNAQEALALAETRLGAHHNQTVLALVELSLALQRNGKKASALEMGEAAWMRALEAYGGSRTHPNVLKAQVARAEALAANGAVDRAVRAIEEAIAAAEALFGAESRMAEAYRRTLARIQGMRQDLRSGNKTRRRPEPPPST